MQKKITFFIGSMGHGGAQRVISLLCNELVKRFEEVEVLSYYNNPILYQLDERVHYRSVVDDNGTDIFRNIIWMRRYFKKNSKIVLSFLAPFNMIAIISLFFSNIPIIVADRNDPTKVPVTFWMRKLRDFLYCFADHVVVQTKKNQNYFGRIIKRKSSVIYNPIDLKELQGSALKADKNKKIVSVARLEKQKNQKMLIRAFKQVLKKHSDYVLVLYGEGPYREELERFIKEEELVGVVQLPGNVPNVLKLERDAEIFVLSSDYEGMPNALLEAMCLGLPCISTRVSGATDLIQDKLNGVLVDISNTDELASKMIEMVESKALREIYAKRAVLLADELKVNMITDRWMQLIEKLVL